MDRVETEAVSGAQSSAADSRRIREVIAAAFTRLQVRQRARVLRRLLLPVGPLALRVLAGGAFAKYVAQARSPRLKVAVEEAARVTTAQVLELARYAEQSNPTALARALRIIGRHIAGTAVLACERP